MAPLYFRFRTLLCLFALAFLTEARAAQGPSMALAPAPAAEMRRPPLVLALPDMSKVRITRGLDYAASGNPHVLMDVYHPLGSKGAGKRPAVLMIHGGGMRSTPDQRPNEWGSYQAWGRLLAASGWVGVMFNHRLGRGLTSTAAADVAAAISYVKANSDGLGVDPKRLCLMVFSGGGPLISDYVNGAPEEIKCLIGFYPFLDLRSSSDHIAGERAKTVQHFSAVTRLDDQGRKPPLLLFRSGADHIKPLLASIDRFVAAALANDHPLTLINVVGAPHGFDYGEPRPLYAEALRTALLFLETHLASEQLR